MDAQDYPIRHFEHMTLLASSLKSLSAQVIEHQYHYDSFGSWLIVLRTKGVRLRLSFDGKESAYSIERSDARKPPDTWVERRWLDLPSGDSFPLPSLVASVVEAAA